MALLWILTIHDLLIAIVVILILAMLLIISVLLYGFYKYRILHNKQIWINVIEQRVEKAIVEGDDGSVVAKDSFSAHLRERSFRSLFLSALVSAERKFSGIAYENIKKLFEKYNLEREAWWKIRQRQPYIIGGGIQELTTMKVERSISVIEKLLHHHSPEVYLEAQYAMVSFKDFGGLHFFYELKHTMSEWQQLRLLRSVKEIPLDHKEHILAWLNSSNTSVVIFTLRLIREFQLLAFYDTVFKLFDHNAVMVRIETIKTLESLENDETADQFILVFDVQVHDVQLEILKALRNLKDHKSEEFLKQQLINNEAPSIKVVAAEALLKLGNLQLLKNLASDGESPEQLKQIIKHALQEKIC